MSKQCENMAEYVHVGEKGVKIMRDKYRADLSIYIYIYLDILIKRMIFHLVARESEVKGSVNYIMVARKICDFHCYMIILLES